MTRDDDRSRTPSGGPTLHGLPSGDALDVELSALLDDELDPAAADALRGRIAREPELAARFEQLGELDGQLGRLADALPSEARLARLRVGLQERIDAEAASGHVDAAPLGAPPAASGVAPVISIGLRRRWMAPAAAALAAGLALYLLSGSPPGDPARSPGVGPELAGVDPPLRFTPAPERVEALARREAPVEVEPTVIPDPPTEPTGTPTPSPTRQALAGLDATGRGPAVETVVAAAEEPTGAMAPDAGAESAPEIAPLATEDPLLASASEVELALAMEYEVLSDLDVIENLELLELLAMLDGPEPL